METIVFCQPLEEFTNRFEDAFCIIIVAVITLGRNDQILNKKMMSSLYLAEIDLV